MGGGGGRGRWSLQCIRAVMASHVPPSNLHPVSQASQPSHRTGRTLTQKKHPQLRVNLTHYIHSLGGKKLQYHISHLQDGLAYSSMPATVPYQLGRVTWCLNSSHGCTWWAHSSPQIILKFSDTPIMPTVYRMWEPRPTHYMYTLHVHTTCSSHNTTSSC